MTAGVADDLIEIAAVMSESPDATLAIGGALSAHLEAGDIIALSGDLGLGKSTFARGFIGAALARNGLDTDDIPSPTFTLVQTYPFASEHDSEREIWHLDCWRLESPEEILELGFDEVAGRHLALIEWPEKMGRYLPLDALTIIFDEKGEGAASDLRKLGFHAAAAFAPRWREKLIAAGLA